MKLDEQFTAIKNLFWALSFLFKNYSFVEVINLLITCNKIKLFLLNTNNTNKNSVTKQNTSLSPKHTNTHTLKQIPKKDSTVS